jgi:hypothetical protein
MRKALVTLVLTAGALGIGVALPASAFATVPKSKYTTDSSTGRTWRTDYFAPIKRLDPDKWCKDHGYDGGFLSGNGYWGCTVEVGAATT